MGANFKKDAQVIIILQGSVFNDSHFDSLSHKRRDPSSRNASYPQMVVHNKNRQNAKKILKKIKSTFPPSLSSPRDARSYPQRE